MEIEITRLPLRMVAHWDSGSAAITSEGTEMAFTDIKDTTPILYVTAVSKLMFNLVLDIVPDVVLLPAFTQLYEDICSNMLPSEALNKFAENIPRNRDTCSF